MIIIIRKHTENISHLFSGIDYPCGIIYLFSESTVDNCSFGICSTRQLIARTHLHARPTITQSTSNHQDNWSPQILRITTITHQSIAHCDNLQASQLQLIVLTRTLAQPTLKSLNMSSSMASVM